MQRWRLTTILVAALTNALLLLFVLCTLITPCGCTWLSSSLGSPSQAAPVRLRTRASDCHAWKQGIYPGVNWQQPCIFLLRLDGVKGIHRKHLRVESLVFNPVVSGPRVGAKVVKGSPFRIEQSRLAEDYDGLRAAVGTRPMLGSGWKEISLDASAFFRSLPDGISRDKESWSLKKSGVNVQVSEAGEWRTYHTDDPGYAKDKSYQASLATSIDDGLQAESLAKRQLESRLLNHRRHLMSVPRGKEGSYSSRISAVAVGSIAVVSLLGMFFFVSRKRLPNGSSKYVIVPCLNCNPKPRSAHGRNNCVPPSQPRPPRRPLRVFQFKELDQATNKFSTKIGSGGFGEVFRGELSCGTLIAVKKGIPAANDTDGMMEMLKEIEILSALSHRHLVKLLGYCHVDTPSQNVILVYEYVPNGTLADHIYGPLSRNVLSWAERLRIARDAARAIAYLHSGTTGKNQATRHKTKISVIHRDIKPSNILLDANLRAKVGDFGISTVVENMETHITTGPKGTTGYVDPLYQVSHQLTQKSDVYSFGIVLLELVSGRKAVDLTRAQEDWQVLSWCNTIYPAQGCEAVTDPRLQRGTYSCKSVTKIIDCAILCCQQYSRNRPDICRVLEMIEEAIRIQTSDGSYARSDDSFGPSSLASTPKKSTSTPPHVFPEVKVPRYRPDS